MNNGNPLLLDPELRMNNDVEITLRLALQIANDVIPFEQHRVYLFWQDESEALWSFPTGFFKGTEEELEVSRTFEKQLHDSGRPVFQAKPAEKWMSLLRVEVPGEAVGHLAIGRKKSGKYTRNELYHLRLVAQLIRGALSSKKNAELLRRLHLNFLDGRTLLQELTPKEILAEYLQKAVHVCHGISVDDFERAKNGDIGATKGWVIRPTAKRITPNRMALLISAYDSTERGEWTKERTDFVYPSGEEGQKPESIAAHVYLHQRLYLTNDYQNCPLVNSLRFDNTKSHMSAAMVAGHALCAGVLTIETSKPDAYSRMAGAAFALLAAHAFWPFSRASRREATTKKVLTFTDALSTLRNETTATRLLQKLEEALKDLDYGRGLISRVDYQERRVIGIQAWGEKMAKVMEQTNRHFDDDKGDCQVLAVADKKPQFIAKPWKETETRAKRLAVQDGDLKPFAVFPLVDNHSRVCWTLHVERSDTAAIGKADDRLVSALCLRVMKSLEEERRTETERNWSRQMLEIRPLTLQCLLRGFVDFVVREGIAVRCRAFLIDEYNVQHPFYVAPHLPKFYSVVLDQRDTDILNVRKPLLFVRGGYETTLKSSDEFDVIKNVDEAHPELDNVHRSQWAEAPIDCRGRIVAKIVFDHWEAATDACAQRVDAFTLGEMRQIARYARTLSIATEAVEVQQRDHDHLQIIREFSQRFVAEIGEQTKEKIRPAVIQLLLEMYLKMTNADVVFYRRVEGDALVLASEPVWRSPPRADHSGPFGTLSTMKVPERKKKGEGVCSRILETTPREPIFENEAHSALGPIDATRWTPGEMKFLAWIGSEACIPVEVRGEDGRELRGVIVAVCNKPHAFTDDLTPSLERFWHTASLWFELGELHHGRLWWDEILRNVIEELPNLAAATNDAAFFAGLSALLSHHKGMGWNRVMIWSCQGSAPETAELVYALGGVGDNEQVRLHQHVEVDPSLSDLSGLVARRLKDPVPHGPNEFGKDVLDPLYELVVSGPNSLQVPEPIRIAFGPDIAPVANHPLREMLEHNYAKVPFSFPIPSELKVEGWLAEAKEKYPGMFLGQMLAYPLWCSYDRRPEPLGLILVDMHYSPQKRDKEMIRATRVVLELVSDILASRYQQRRLIGWLGVLPNVRHGRGLKEAWETLYDQSGLFFKGLSILPKKAGDFLPSEADFYRLVQRFVKTDKGKEADQNAFVQWVQSAREDVDTKVKKYLEAHKAAQDRVLQQFDSTIPNLESFLKEVAQGCQKGYNKLVGIEASNPASGDPLEGHQKVSLEVRLCAETVAGVPLVCDPMVLTGALHCLIGNAVSAMRLANSPKLFVRLDAAWERSPSGNFDKIIVIRVTDVGPGIRSEIAPFIFLEGFSWRNQAAETKPVEETKHKGRGLPIARAQMLAYSGDLQLESGGPRTEPTLPGGQAGATFVIRFGVKPSSVARPE